MSITGHSHPAPKDESEVKVGKYAAIVAMNSRDQQPLSEEQVALGRQLCQHVIGELNLNHMG